MTFLYGDITNANLAQFLLQVKGICLLRVAIVVEYNVQLFIGEPNIDEQLFIEFLQ